MSYFSKSLSHFYVWMKYCVTEYLCAENQIEIISSATMAALEAKRNNPGHDSLKSAYKQSSSAYCSSFNSKNLFILFKN